jgi:hypothetical protein
MQNKNQKGSAVDYAPRDITQELIDSAKSVYDTLFASF